MGFLIMLLFIIIVKMMLLSAALLVIILTCMITFEYFKNVLMIIESAVKGTLKETFQEVKNEECD